MQPFLKSVGALSEINLNNYIISLFDLRTAVDHAVECLRKDETYFQYP